MRQIKRMAVLLIAAALLILTPMSALAARQEYVPTKVVFYELKDGNWVACYEETYSYTKNARLKAYTYKSLTSSYTATTTYTWKGNFLKKAEYPTYTSTYSYKNKKLTSSTSMHNPSKEVTTQSVSWKKRKGVFTNSNGTTGNITVNKRNQMINFTLVYSNGKKFTTTLKYYGNGNLKSESYSGPDYSYVIKYNRKGYPISNKSDFGEETYKYKKNRKGQITEQLIISKTNGGVKSYKRVFSRWKKISRSVRNCDAFGNTVYTPYSD